MFNYQNIKIHRYLNSQTRQLSSARGRVRKEWDPEMWDVVTSDIQGLESIDPLEYSVMKEVVHSPLPHAQLLASVAGLTCLMTM